MLNCSRRCCIVIASLALSLAGWAGAAEKSSPAPTTRPAGAAKFGYEWTSLFDGKTLGNWKPTDFGGQAEIKIKDGHLILPTGNDMTGVTWSGEYPKMDYEIAFDTRRVDGNDIFCVYTFPFLGTSASLVLGGWGGSVCGISSIDNFDAADNATTKILNFKDNQWYAVRIRVTKNRVQCWLDEERIVNTEASEKRLSVRMECEPCRPMGIATWRTSGAVRDIRVRLLRPDETKLTDDPDQM